MHVRARGIAGSNKYLLSLWCQNSETKRFVGGPWRREKSLPSLFPSPQAISKEHIAFSGQNAPNPFNCTFQQIYELLLCHLLAWGWSVQVVI